MEPAHDSDERLMRRVAGGEREPLSVLLRRHATPLLTFLRRMIGDHHRSEELFQEVFLAVWAGRRKYQFPRPFRAWLFGIAANKCRAEQRSRSTCRIAGGRGDEALAATTEPSPVEIAIAAETAVLVRQAVLRLPARQRSVVVLRLWNCLSYAEIAIALQRTEATVRSHMFHALKAIRKDLEPRLR